MIKVLEFERVQRYRYILNFLELIYLVLYMYISWYIYIYISWIWKCAKIYICNSMEGGKLKGTLIILHFQKWRKHNKQKKGELTILIKSVNMFKFFIRQFKINLA